MCTGDAILSFWKCSYVDEDGTRTVTSVVEKCLQIQQQHDNYQAGEDINLRVKLAVSVGDLFVYHLGKFSVCSQKEYGQSKKGVIFNAVILSDSQPSPRLHSSAF